MGQRYITLDKMPCLLRDDTALVIDVMHKQYQRNEQNRRLINKMIKYV